MRHLILDNSPMELEIELHHSEFQLKPGMTMEKATSRTEDLLQTLIHMSLLQS